MMIIPRLNASIQCPMCRSLIPQCISSRLSHQAVNQKANLSFVPAHKATDTQDVAALQDFINKSTRIFVLTGAGLSTESGIPDYRSEGVGLYARTTRRPMKYQEFIKSAEARQRYWARNFVGWPKMSSTEPNNAHHTLAEWWKKGKVSSIVTQNVDHLHTKAGATDTIELHGCLHRVKCISCHRQIKRHDLQKTFEAWNPGWKIIDMPIAPDGDVLLEEAQVAGFKVPPCDSCGGPLMPDVTFFGDNVARLLVEKVFSLVDEADSMLVAGSSLQVYSGYRFVKRAAERKIPIAVVNIGETRGDDLADLKIESVAGSLFPQVKVEPL